MEEVSILVNLANSFHPTINFTCEMPSEGAVFLDNEVFKGPRLSTLLLYTYRISLNFAKRYI